LTLKLICFIVHEMGNSGTNFDVSGTFRSRVMGQHLSDGPRDLATLTFDLEVTALIGHTGLRSLSATKLEVRMLFRSKDMTHFYSEH